MPSSTSSAGRSSAAGATTVTSKFPQLRPDTGNELPEQARDKQDGAEDESRLDGHPRGADALPCGDERPTHYGAQEHEHGTGKAKEQQWLRRKLQLEPDREHVEHADRNSRDAELRFSGVTWIQRHGNLPH